MKKATIAKFYVRECYGQLSEIVNARQEIKRGKANYGVCWKFSEISKDNFLDVLGGKKGLVETLAYTCIDVQYPILAVETKSGKILEIDKNDIGKFTNL